MPMGWAHSVYIATLVDIVNILFTKRRSDGPFLRKKVATRKIMVKLWECKTQSRRLRHRHLQLTRAPTRPRRSHGPSKSGLRHRRRWLPATQAQLQPQINEERILVPLGTERKTSSSTLFLSLKKKSITKTPSFFMLLASTLL